MAARRDINIVIRGRDEASRAMKSVEKSTARLSKSFMSLKSVAVGALGGVFMARALTSSAKAAAEFQTEMARVNTMLTVTSQHLLPSLTQEVKNLSVEFGATTASLSDGLFNILSASIDASKAVGVLRIATETAKGGFTDTGTAVSGIVNLLNSYRLEASKASEVSDLMFATFKRGQLTIAQLASNIGKVAPQAATAGVSMQTMLAALATLTRTGLSTEESVTRLNGVIKVFVKNTDKQREAAALLGLDLSETTIRGEGLIDVMKLLGKADLTTIAEIFQDIRGTSGAAILSKDLRGFSKDLALMSEAAGARGEAFAKVVNTTTEQVSRLQQSWKGFSREFGTNMLTLGGDMGKMTTIITRFTEAIDLSNESLVQTANRAERKEERLDRKRLEFIVGAKKAREAGRGGFDQPAAENIKLADFRGVGPFRDTSAFHRALREPTTSKFFLAAQVQLDALNARAPRPPGVSVSARRLQDETMKDIRKAYEKQLNADKSTRLKAEAEKRAERIALDKLAKSGLAEDIAFRKTGRSPVADQDEWLSIQREMLESTRNIEQSLQGAAEEVVEIAP